MSNNNPTIEDRYLNLFSGDEENAKLALEAMETAQYRARERGTNIWFCIMFNVHGYPRHAKSDDGITFQSPKGKYRGE